MSKPISIQGHRGARGHLPENTLQGFIKAVELGADALELDVVISADQQVVVSHEAWMNPLICSLPDGTPIAQGKGKTYNLYHMAYAEIRTFDCGKRGHPEFPGQLPIPACKPLLSEVIATIEDFTKRTSLKAVAYNIEIKTEGEDGRFNPAPALFAELVSREIMRHQIDDRLAVQSFDVRILQQMRSSHAALSLGLLVENQQSVPVSLRQLGFTPATYSPEFIMVNEKMVEEVHAGGMKIVPWTVNEIPHMEHLIGLGGDGIISDYPDRLVGLLKRTGHD